MNELKPRLEHQKECSSKIDDFLSNQIHIDKAVSNAKVILSQIQEKTESLGTILKNLEKQTQALQQTQVSTCNDMYKVKTDINQGLDDIAKLKEALSEIGSYIANSMQTEIKIDQFLKEQQNHQDAIKKLQQTLTEIDRKVTNLKYGAASLENDISVSKNNYYKSKEDLIRIQQQVSNYFSNSERFKNYVLDVVSENLYVQHVTLNNRYIILINNYYCFLIVVFKK